MTWATFIAGMLIGCVLTSVMWMVLLGMMTLVGCKTWKGIVLSKWRELKLFFSFP